MVIVSGVIGFIIGVFFGLVMMALIAANGDDRDDEDRH